MTLIPEHLDEITPDWLTEVLRERGHLPRGKVSALSQESLGEGEGFMGVIARLSVSYDGDDAGDATGDPRQSPPRTLIAKLPTPVEQNRVMGEVLGAYWREIHFYEELSTEMPVRVPRIYHADLTPDPMREKQDQIVRMLDRTPAFILNLLMRFSGRLVKRNAHRYVLLIEDLAPARVGDQVVGASVETCARVLDTAARMHAAFWQSPVLDEKFWFSRHKSGPRTRQRMYKKAWKAFSKAHASMLGPEGLDLLTWAARHGEGIGAALHDEPPQTLVHSDLRLDNIFFDDGNETDPVVLADWQLAGVGAAAYDVAYLLSGALAADATAEDEKALLAGYHAALCRAGVSGYSLDDLTLDYQRGLLSVLQILATTDEVDMGADRGVTLMQGWVERTLARLSGVDREALLPGNGRKRA